MHIMRHITRLELNLNLHQFDFVLILRFTLSFSTYVNFQNLMFVAIQTSVYFHKLKDKKGEARILI